MKRINFLTIQALAFIFSAAGMTANYECKFSIPGSSAKSNFDGSNALVGFMVGDFEFAVRPINIASPDNPPQNVDGFSITVMGRGLKTMAVAPMGTSVVGLINETFNVTASCRIK